MPATTPRVKTFVVEAGFAFNAKEEWPMNASKRPPRLPNETRVRVASDHFEGRCEGVVTRVDYDDGWLYRIEVTAGDRLDAQRNAEGELWVCDFEVQPLLGAAEVQR